MHCYICNQALIYVMSCQVWETQWGDLNEGLRCTPPTKCMSLVRSDAVNAPCSVKYATSYHQKQSIQIYHFVVVSLHQYSWETSAHLLDKVGQVMWSPGKKYFIFYKHYKRFAKL